MQAKQKIVSALNTVLEKVDAEIVRKSKLDRLGYRLFSRGPSYNKQMLPDGAEDYLQPDNPRLKELKRRYLATGSPVTDHSAWSDGHVSSTDLQYFRGDSIYVWQYRNWNNEINYLLTAYYIRAMDTLNLWNLLEEDDLFGVHTFYCDGRLVSRDLLDSMVEIYFLEEMLHISQLKVNILDIGSGYGRFAYRITKALTNINKVFCTDAIAESTFVCEYYLRFRGVEDKAVVVPVDEMEQVLATYPIDIALNIHSFPECTLSAITWWLNLISRYQVKYLMIVPHESPDGELLSCERDGSRVDFTAAIGASGYKLMTKRCKYQDLSLHKYGITPTHYYLFELVTPPRHGERKPL